MARIIYPEALLQQIDLLKAIKNRHDTLAGASPLIAFLLSKGIVLADDLGASVTALQHHDKAALYERQSENSFQLRNLHWNPVMFHLRAYHQFLKAFYKPNFMEVGTWGVSINASGKILYPPDFLQRTQVIEALKDKHDSFAPNPSPLDPFITEHNADLGDDINETNIAKGHHADAISKAQQAEDETELRNLDWDPVVKHLHQIGNFLKKLFKTNPKQMGLWGFTVDSSPRAPKYQTSKVLPGGQITVKSITIGGTLTNTGTVPLHLYKGIGSAGAPEVIQPNAMFGTIAGYSTITVMNPSTLIAGKFKALRSQ